MRPGEIAVAVMSLIIVSTAPCSYGDVAYGVGDFMGFDAFSGVGVLDTTASTSDMFIHTPGLRWYGATDGPQ